MPYLNQWVKLFFGLGCCMLSLTACSTGSDASFDSANRPQGGLIGSATSAPKSWSLVLGSELVGGLVGNQLGQYMDKDDARRAESIYTSAKGQGRWVNHETGYIYTIKPVKQFKKSDMSCRVYKTRAQIGDRRRTVYGTACKHVDGQWQLAVRPKSLLPRHASSLII